MLTDARDEVSFLEVAEDDNVGGCLVLEEQQILNGLWVNALEALEVSVGRNDSEAEDKKKGCCWKCLCEK